MRHPFNPQLFMRLICVVILTITLAPALSPGSPMGAFIIQGKNLDSITQLVESHGGYVTARLEIINAVSASIPEYSVNRLRNEPGIYQISPNGPVQIADTANGNSSPITDYPDLVGADYVWEENVIGSGVTVAIVDTGMTRHPGLVIKENKQPGDRIVGWMDFVDGKKSPVDPNGHGTHIAGIIANSQIGPDGEWNGVAPGVQLVGVRVLDKDGHGTYERVIQGIEWVIENKDRLNIKVLNLSIVAPAELPYWADPLNKAIMKAWAEGITVVVAAGNSGPSAVTIGVPGNNPYAITVGAFTDNFTAENWADDYITPFSSAGPSMDWFVKPDVVAPGAHIVSTVMERSGLADEHPESKFPGHYFSMAGTSQASAVVSGIAALILSKNPDLTPDEVKYRIQVTALPWINTETTEALYSMWQQGFGRVNAPDAVFAPIDGYANNGLDIDADLADTHHYEGYTYYDEATGLYRLKDDFGSWAGGYGAWAGGYGAWAGGYGAWAGGYGAWAGGYGAWAGGYGAWAGGYGAWAGGYGAWAGTTDEPSPSIYIPENQNPDQKENNESWTGTWVDFN